jgi:hypothetical protein
MPNFQVTELALIVIAICVTIIFGMFLFKMKKGLKVKIDKSGVELDLTQNEPDENKEIKNETDITV